MKDSVFIKKDYNKDNLNKKLSNFTKAPFFRKKDTYLPDLDEMSTPKSVSITSLSDISSPNLDSSPKHIMNISYRHSPVITSPATIRFPDPKVIFRGKKKIKGTRKIKSNI